MKHAAMRQRMVIHAGDARPLVIASGHLVLRYGEVPCPFGICRIADTESGISHLSFADHKDSASLRKEVRRAWPEAVFHHDEAHARKLADVIFSAEDPQPLLLVSGTPFQIAVWRALLEIPPGGTLSYGKLATMLGRPRASRAIGAAVGANRIAWLIPCHRVLRADGATGGYRWGTDRKRAMLAWEAARI